MTERQYNSKLLGDKLSQLPVSPNDLLWSKIEAQLVATPPTFHPPLKAASHFTRSVLIKVSIAVFSTIPLVLFILWVVRKHQPTQRSTTPVKKTLVADTVKAATPTIIDSVPKQQKIPAQLLPIKQEPKTEAVDTAGNGTTLRPLHSSDIHLSVQDSLLPAPLTLSTTADSIKLKTVPPKKDDQYYLEIKKKGY